MFDTQKSGNKTSSGEIGLDIRKHASPKVGQDQMSGGVSVLCWHAAPIANVLWKPRTVIGKKSNSVIRSRSWSSYISWTMRFISGKNKYESRFENYW